MSLEAIILEEMTILTAHRPQNLLSSLLDIPYLPAFEDIVFFTMDRVKSELFYICDTEKELQHIVTVSTNLENARL